MNKLSGGGRLHTKNKQFWFMLFCFTANEMRKKKYVKGKNCFDKNSKQPCEKSIFYAIKSERIM